VGPGLDAPAPSPAVVKASITANAAVDARASRVLSASSWEHSWRSSVAPGRATVGWREPQADPSSQDLAGTGAAPAGPGALERAESSRILVIRHRQSTWNAERRWTGQFDPPLSARGMAQASEIAPVLATLQFATVASSDLRRALQTAAIIAAHLPDASLLVDPRLREHSVPQWSGLTRAEIEVRWPLAAHAAWKNGERANLPGAEPWVDVEQRVTEALYELLDRGSQTLVVAHSGVLGVLRTAVGAVELPNRSKGIWVQQRGGRLHAGPLQRLRPAARATTSDTGRRPGSSE